MQRRKKNFIPAAIMMVVVLVFSAIFAATTNVSTVFAAQTLTFQEAETRCNRLNVEAGGVYDDPHIYVCKMSQANQNPCIAMGGNPLGKSDKYGGKYYICEFVIDPDTNPGNSSSDPSDPSNPSNPGGGSGGSGGSGGGGSSGGGSVFGDRPNSSADVTTPSTAILDPNLGVSGIIILVVNIFSVLIGIVGVLGIVIVGIQYLTAADNEEKTRKAKRRLFEIIIGLVAYAAGYALLSWLLPDFSQSATNANSLIIPLITFLGV